VKTPAPIMFATTIATSVGTPSRRRDALADWPWLNGIASEGCSSRAGPEA
jgi:hypothetical protein